MPFRPISLPDVLLPATKPSRMYPTCETDEYAKSRLVLFWLIAARLPTVIETTAITASIGAHEGRSGPRPITKMRTRNANAAAFGAVERKAVTAVGAPS